MHDCALSYFDFFISLFSVYYGFTDQSHSHTQWLSFANSDLINCSPSLSYKEKWMLILTRIITVSGEVVKKK